MLTYYIEKLSGLFFIIAGLYGLHGLDFFGKQDLYYSAILGVLLLIIIFIFKFSKTKSVIKKIIQSTMFVLSIVVWAFIWNYCSTQVSNLSMIHVCGVKVNCPHCVSCYVLFTIGAIITASLYVLANALLVKRRRVKKRIKSLA